MLKKGTHLVSGLARKLPALALVVLASSVGASPLFEEDTVLHVNLVGPLSSLIEDREERGELPFVLLWDDVEYPIKVRVRGKSRARLCAFPPLRINFAVAEMEHTIFAGQDKLKLVTHCRASSSAEADTLEEYAAYRIFSLISNVSFRVRLLRITYTDTDGHPGDNVSERYGFLVESASELADRVGGEAAHVSGVSLASLDDQQAASVYVFQYLIGNTDWSLVTADGDETCCHNGDLFDIESRRYYVPYDFDLAGLVNARYARPDPSLRMSSVTRRRYRGHCISADALMDALRAIKAWRADIMDVIAELPGLSPENIEAKVRYLDGFFDQAGDEDKLLRSFERRCR